MNEERAPERMDGSAWSRFWQAAGEKVRGALKREDKRQRFGRIRVERAPSTRESNRAAGLRRMSGRRPTMRYPSPSKRRGIPMAARWAQQDALDAERERARRKASR